MMLALVLAMTPGARAECADLTALVRDIGKALENVELEEAQRLAQGVDEALACQAEPINSITLTSLMQLSGAVQLFGGDNEAADELFAWAVSISPSSTLEAIYGDDAAARYQEVRSKVMLAQPGRLKLNGSATSWLDGRQVPTGQEFDLAPGPHLLQFKLDDSPTQSRVVRVEAGESRAFPVGGVVAPEPAPPSALSVNPILAAGGAVGVIGGGVLMALAARAHGEFDAATDPSVLTDLQSKTNTLGAAGLGLTAVGLGVAGASVLLDTGFLPGQSSFGLTLVWSH